MLLNIEDLKNKATEYGVLNYTEFDGSTDIAQIAALSYERGYIIASIDSKDGKGVTKEEKDVMDLIVKAHTVYIQLEKTHPLDIHEWVGHIHGLQHILGMRILRREHPELFATIKR